MNLHRTQHYKNILESNSFFHFATVICLQYLDVKYYIIQYLVEKCEMPIKFKHKKDVLISSHELHGDDLIMAHLYELLSVVC